MYCLTGRLRQDIMASTKRIRISSAAGAKCCRNNAKIFSILILFEFSPNSALSVFFYLRLPIFYACIENADFFFFFFLSIFKHDIPCFPAFLLFFFFFVYFIKLADVSLYYYYSHHNIYTYIFCFVLKSNSFFT